jgi:hypothetical protein
MRKSLFILLAVLCASPTLCGDEPASDHDGPIVVLKNGAVLRGKGTNFGEKIRVDLTDGGEVVVAKTQVELMADSLEDAYLQRRKKLMTDNVLSQIDLARWCYEQGLETEAHKHLRDAKKIDSTHPGIVRLERKIRDQERVAEEEQPPPETEKPPVENLKDKLKDKLDAARRDAHVDAGDISPASKIQFNKSVQPILLGSCAASKCHGPSSDSKFRLARSTRSSSQSQHHAVLIKRNLQNVLSRLNIDAPEESPLLENAVQAHSDTMRSPPIDITSDEFSLLVEWVIMATDDLKSPAAMAAKAAPQVASMPKSNLPQNDEPLNEETAPPRKTPSTTPRGEPKAANKPPKTTPRSRAAAKKSKQEDEPAANDPSEFNQEYFPNRPR